MNFDKTLSELWNLTEHEDIRVTVVAKMAIRVINDLDLENSKSRIKIDKIKEFIRDV